MKSNNPKGNVASVKKAAAASVKSPKRHKFTSETSRMAIMMRELGKEYGYVRRGKSHS